MKLHELIGNALKELETAKRYEEKRNYLIDEVTLEISVTSVKTVGGGFEFKVFNVGVDGDASGERENAHKITVKLKPKNEPSNSKTKKNGA